MTATITDLRRWVGDTATDPAVMLGDALDLIRLSGGSLIAHPDEGSIEIQVDAEVPLWAVEALKLWFGLLVTHWRQSPAAIAVCDVCGEVRLMGGRKAPKRCTRASVKKLEPGEWSSRTCVGKLTAIDVPWSTSRPRAKKIPLPTNEESQP